MTTAIVPPQITEITTVEFRHSLLKNEDQFSIKTGNRWTVLPIFNVLKGDPENNLFEAALILHYPYSSIGYRMIDVIGGVVHYEVTREGRLGVDGQYH